MVKVDNNNYETALALHSLAQMGLLDRPTLNWIGGSISFEQKQNKTIKPNEDEHAKYGKNAED